ncbi:MAG TPA: ATP-binding protein [Vitreimonas sp.]|jgi:signal transduction histidine kinase/CheY-like chemotaxis protein|nr:ATP-binding protein [Vitreimonas sp.]
MLSSAEGRAALFAAVLDSMGESVLVVDREGKEVYGNRELRRFRGEEPRPGEAVDDWRAPRNMKIFDKDGKELPPEDWPVARALRGDFKTNFEIRVQGMRHTAEEVTLAISTRSLINTEGLVEGAVIVTRDISAVRSTEEQLRQSQKLETIGQLTGGIAHDFNNMLAAIFSSVEVLKRGVAGNARLEMAVELIDRASNRGADLTRHLLAFARKQTLQPTSVDVRGLVEETLVLARPALGATIEIETQFPAETLYALVDAPQLISVLLNLCINARDAMDGGGKLVVSVSASQETSVGPLPPGEYVRIAVRDTGAGMSEEVMKRAIEPFFTTKGPGKGSGLGLSMVFGFARQSGGDLIIESEIGAGTTMTLLLPRTKAPVEDPAELSALPKLDGKIRVLLVDDDAMVREALALQLDDEGFETVVATDAHHALELIDGGLEFDVLLTDVVMPRGMNGAELAAEVRRRRPHARAILSTGYAEQDVAPQGALILRKPYTVPELFAALRSALRAG